MSPCLPCGRPKWSSWFMAFTWFSPGFYDHLVNEPADEIFLCPTHTLCLLITKKKLYSNSLNKKFQLFLLKDVHWMLATILGYLLKTISLAWMIDRINYTTTRLDLISFSRNWPTALVVCSAKNKINTLDFMKVKYFSVWRGFFFGIFFTTEQDIHYWIKLHSDTNVFYRLNFF